MKNQKRAPEFVVISRTSIKIIALILLIVLLPSCKNKHKEKSEEDLQKMAMEICEKNIILDSHIDWPDRILNIPEDISELTLKGDFDLVRARKGGLNAALSVIYINSNYGVSEGRRMVDSLLNLITYYAKTYPGKFALARNPDEVKQNFKRKLFSLPLSLENGSPIGNDIEYVKHLKDMGIVYITLCHDKTNQISDSNFDTNRKWNGLSPFGLEVIQEMNHLGIIIDISHSTDSTVFQSLRYSRAPIIASHSSCRYNIPGFERNLSDTLIKAIALKNGVVMINFSSMFLDPICLKNCNEAINWLDSNRINMFSKEGVDFLKKFAATHKVVTNSTALIDQIDHIVKIAGIDYVGIGSDFDGIGPTQPQGIPDVSGYPVIVFELLKRGYKESDIKKILSDNFFRVWSDVIKIADSWNKSSSI